MGPEKLEATLILRCNYDLWQGQIGQKLIQEIMNEEKAARKAAADQARTAAFLLSHWLLLSQAACCRC